MTETRIYRKQKKTVQFYHERLFCFGCLLCANLIRSTIKWKIWPTRLFELHTFWIPYFWILFAYVIENIHDVFFQINCTVLILLFLMFLLKTIHWHDQCIRAIEWSNRKTLNSRFDQMSCIQPTQIYIYSFEIFLNVTYPQNWCTTYNHKWYLIIDHIGG